MTLEEIAALASILARIPVTQAEALWVNGLLERLRVEALQKQNGQTEPA